MNDFRAPKKPICAMDEEERKLRPNISGGHHTQRVFASNTLDSYTDSWLALDKAQHLIFCGAVTSAAFAIARHFPSTRSHRLVIGALTGIIAGVLKEVGDVLHWWPGGLSLRDLGADFIGVAAALAVAASWEAYRPAAAERVASSSFADPRASKDPQFADVLLHSSDVKDHQAAAGVVSDGDHLANVGLVTWQCGLQLTDYLLRYPPFHQWHDVRVLDLGAGTGVVGLALALAGADVVMCDLPHITPLTRINVQGNCDTSRHRACVVDYDWGEQPTPASLIEPQPDIIVGADLVYHSADYPALLRALCTLVAPHTLLYLAIKMRGNGEEEFLEGLSQHDFVVDGVAEQFEGEECSMDGGDSYRMVKACRLI